MKKKGRIIKAFLALSLAWALCLSGVPVQLFSSVPEKVEAADPNYSPINVFPGSSTHTYGTISWGGAGSKNDPLTFKLEINPTYNVSTNYFINYANWFNLIRHSYNNNGTHYYYRVNNGGTAYNINDTSRVFEFKDNTQTNQNTINEWAKDL